MLFIYCYLYVIYILLFLLLSSISLFVINFPSYIFRLSRRLRFIHRFRRTSGNSAERRANHNATERARRENLNSRFQELAASIPSLCDARKPSKSQIVAKAIEYIRYCTRKADRRDAAIQELARESHELRQEIHRLRSMLGDGESQSQVPLMPPINVDELLHDDEDEMHRLRLGFTLPVPVQPSSEARRMSTYSDSGRPMVHLPAPPAMFAPGSPSASPSSYPHILSSSATPTSNYQLCSSTTLPLPHTASFPSSCPPQGHFQMMDMSMSRPRVATMDGTDGHGATHLSLPPPYSAAAYNMPPDHPNEPASYIPPEQGTPIPYASSALSALYQQQHPIDPHRGTWAPSPTEQPEGDLDEDRHDQGTLTLFHLLRLRIIDLFSTSYYYVLIFRPISS
jgi:hypothetical protein